MCFPLQLAEMLLLFFFFFFFFFLKKRWLVLSSTIEKLIGTTILLMLPSILCLMDGTEYTICKSQLTTMVTRLFMIVGATD